MFLLLVKIICPDFLSSILSLMIASDSSVFLLGNTCNFRVGFLSLPLISLSLFFFLIFHLFLLNTEKPSHVYSVTELTWLLVCEFWSLFSLQDTHPYHLAVFFQVCSHYDFSVSNATKILTCLLKSCFFVENHFQIYYLLLCPSFLYIKCFSKAFPPILMLVKSPDVWLALWSWSLSIWVWSTLLHLLLENKWMPTLI